MLTLELFSICYKHSTGAVIGNFASQYENDKRGTLKLFTLLTKNRENNRLREYVTV